MSAALGRLRDAFGDDLFVMQSRRLTPTKRAEALATPTRLALQQVSLALLTRDTFDPASSTKRYRVVLSDYMTVVFFARVIERVRQVAPKVAFELLPFGDEPDELLGRGEIDFLIFPDLYLSDRFPRTRLFDERMVCVVSRANTRVGDVLDFETYMAAGHVAAEFGPSRRPAIEEWLLLRHGLRRRIEVVVQAFSMIPHMVVHSDRIATMHARLAEHYAASMPLRIFPLPLPPLRFTEALQWPAQHQSDPASLWLREIILDEARPESVAPSGAAS